jgi:Tfp pilus assembly protein PilX
VIRFRDACYVESTIPRFESLADTIDVDLRQFARDRLRQEDGIALVMALGITVVLIIFVASMIDYTSSNSRAARLSSSQLTALQYADAGLNAAYSIIVNQKATVGGNPAAANMLGCNGVAGAADVNGPSNCTTPAPKIICVAAAAGCVLGTAGSAALYGYYSGTNPTVFNGVSVAASTWLLISTGYARNPQGTSVIKTTTATVPISPLNAGAVAAVWNHMFLTSPLTNVCSVDFGGNNMTITDPIYVIGNMCISGQNTTVQETSGQPIDLMVGGKLVLSGSGAKVGTDLTHPITSGVVVAGCTTISVAMATTACDSGSYSYWVGSKDTFIPQQAPEMLAADITTDYNNSDPGPKHACAAGGLASTSFDGDGVQNGTNTSFELLPNSSYTCVSQSGAGTGQMSWNNTTKTLTINGNVFLDGNLTISQSGTYVGTGVIEAAGTITVNGNATIFCATSPCNTAVNAWQGTSGSNSMLTLVALKSNTTSVIFTDNSQTFQGSLWTQPSSSMTFVKNGVTVEGPISIGKFDATFNNAVFKPLPVIKNMPVGAPIPPNTGASIGSMTITK